MWPGSVEPFTPSHGNPGLEDTFREGLLSLNPRIPYLARTADYVRGFVPTEIVGHMLSAIERYERMQSTLNQHQRNLSPEAAVSLGLAASSCADSLAQVYYLVHTELPEELRRAA